MPPPKARLHSKTGKLKTINKSYTSSGTNSPSAVNISGRSRQNLPTTSTNHSGTQTESTIANANGNAVAPNTAITDTLATQQFELELCWCIQTMEKSLESGNLAAKQAQDTEKTIRLLKSSNQPIVKKRQIMQAAFGDYRAKMLDEEKRLRLESRSIEFVDTTVSTSNTNITNKSHFVKKSLTATLGEKNFQFNFPVNEIENLKIENDAEAANGDTNTSNSDLLESTENDNTVTNTGASIETAECLTTLNNATTINVVKPSSSLAHKLFTSDNSFKFNFSID